MRSTVTWPRDIDQVTEPLSALLQARFSARSGRSAGASTSRARPTAPAWQTASLVHTKVARAVIDEAVLAGRCGFVAGDFFADGLPPADVYILALILHDWDDARATAILRNCRRSLPEGGRLLLLEATVSEGSEPSLAKIIDLQMLVVPGGKERTEAEWHALLHARGFALSRIVAGDDENHLIESAAA